jgi:hypothetical protein
LIEHLVSHLMVEGSCPACAQMFFRYTAGNSGGPENSVENSGTNGKKHFCSMYESSLRHPVWALKMNVTACNSAHSKILQHHPPTLDSDDQRPPSNEGRTSTQTAIAVLFLSPFLFSLHPCIKKTVRYWKYLNSLGLSLFLFPHISL